MSRGILYLHVSALAERTARSGTCQARSAHTWSTNSWRGAYAGGWASSSSGGGDGGLTAVVWAWMRLISHSAPEAHAYWDTPYLALELMPKVSPWGAFPAATTSSFVAPHGSLA